MRRSLRLPALRRRSPRHRPGGCLSSHMLSNPLVCLCVSLGVSMMIGTEDLVLAFVSNSMDRDVDNEGQTGNLDMSLTRRLLYAQGLPQHHTIKGIRNPLILQHAHSPIIHNQLSTFFA